MDRSEMLTKMREGNGFIAALDQSGGSTPKPVYERLAETRRTRDKERWRSSLEELRRAAKANGELMPRFLECARAYASVGEQVAVLKEVFGEYHDPGYF